MAYMLSLGSSSVTIFLPRLVFVSSSIFIFNYLSNPTVDIYRISNDEDDVDVISIACYYKQWNQFLAIAVINDNSC